jgi:superfamily II DNA or RNA helicase
MAARRLNAIEHFSPDILIFDEAHQATARTFRSVIRTGLKRKGARVVGLSATPGRSVDGESDDLRSLFGGRLMTSAELGARPVEALVARGILAKLVINTIQLPKQWDSVRVRRSTGAALSIDQLALNSARFWATVDAVNALGPQARVLVFGASLAHLYALAGALSSRGVTSGIVSYATAPNRRSELLRRFAVGEVRVLLNKQLLATGYDCPAITDVVLASPIRSPIMWEQILGRASRGPAVGGTNVGNIWELDDHRAMHTAVLSSARFLGDLWS